MISANGCFTAFAFIPSSGEIVIQSSDTFVRQRAAMSLVATAPQRQMELSWSTHFCHTEQVSESKGCMVLLIRRVAKREGQKSNEPGHQVRTMQVASKHLHQDLD